MVSDYDNLFIEKNLKLSYPNSKVISEKNNSVIDK